MKACAIVAARNVMSPPAASAALRAVLALALGLSLLPASSEAVTNCKVHVSSKTGLIDVFASAVSGPLLWGDRPGAESASFANAPTCIVGSSARRCQFGAPGTLEAITPPDLCTVYLKDSGPGCAAYIKGCTPGPRFTDQTKADDLKALVAAVSFHHSVPTMVFTGVNVQIVSGSGATYAPVNGSGNLIIGYNAATCTLGGTLCSADTDCPANTCVGICVYDNQACVTDADCQPNLCDDTAGKAGSHNLVIGDGHVFTSSGGLVAGLQNSITGAHASVTGGLQNAASGFGASVTGGSNNTASAATSWVGGGSDNTASGATASVSGGLVNTASGDLASVSGGSRNTASGSRASVTAGFNNTASGNEASVTGGYNNRASGPVTLVSGGECNVAGVGPPPSCGGSPPILGGGSVSGGFSNVASGTTASVSGGVSNTAGGLCASVSGGGSNMALSDISSVSGGALLTAGTTSFEWHSGRSSGFPTGTEY